MQSLVLPVLLPLEFVADVAGSLDEHVEDIDNESNIVAVVVFNPVFFIETIFFLRSLQFFIMFFNLTNSQLLL